MIEYRQLRFDELDDWFDHCALVFGDLGVYREVFLHHWHDDPWRDIKDILVAVEDGKILSSVRIFHRDIFFFGQSVSMGGIGEVGTNPKHQGKGLANRLLKLAIEQMKAHNVHISMLVAEIRGYYEKLGWRQVIMFNKVSDVYGDEGFPYSIRQLNFETDLQSVKAIYEEYSGKYNGAVVRNSGFYWENWVKDKVGSWVVEDGKGNLICYIYIKDKGEQVVAREFGCVLSREDIFDSLIARICSMLGKSCCEVIYHGGIKSNLDVKRVEEVPYYMYMLITPFEVGRVKVENTGQLIGAMKGESSSVSGPGFLYWETDNF